MTEDTIKATADEAVKDTEDTKKTTADETVKDTKNTKKTIKATVDEAEPKKYVVRTQIPNYCGTVANIQFAYGKAIVNDGWLVNWFREKGYIVEEAE